MSCESGMLWTNFIFSPSRVLLNYGSDVKILVLSFLRFCKLLKLIISGYKYSFISMPGYFCPNLLHLINSPFSNKITQMKKLITILLLQSLIFHPSFLTAEMREKERRIEEEKRRALLPEKPRPPVQHAKMPSTFAPEDLIYFAGLMQKKVTFRYDACKAVVVLMGVKDRYIDLDSQIIFLRQRDLLPEEFEDRFDPMQPLRKGLLAYMVYSALDMRGGIALTLFGRSERYSLKELVFKGIMAEGNTKDIVTGEELFSVTIQALDYMEKRKQEKK